jgi:hypothetical protein
MSPVAEPAGNGGFPPGSGPRECPAPEGPRRPLGVAKAYLDAPRPLTGGSQAAELEVRVGEKIRQCCVDFTRCVGLLGAEQRLGSGSLQQEACPQLLHPCVGICPLVRQHPRLMPRSLAKGTQ